jgi:hypothetical protein
MKVVYENQLLRALHTLKALREVDLLDLAEYHPQTAILSTYPTFTVFCIVAFAVSSCSHSNPIFIYSFQSVRNIER